MPRAAPPSKGCNYLVYPYASCRAGREPARLWLSLPKATSISVPSSPCPPCLCHLLAACCWLPAPQRGWGQLALSPVVVAAALGCCCPVEGTRSGSTSLVSVPDLFRTRGVVPTELPGLSWRTGHPRGWRGSGYLARASLWGSPRPSRCPRTVGEGGAGSSPEARGGHVPPMPGIPENGQDVISWPGCPVSDCPRGRTEATLGLFLSCPIQTSA